MLIGAEPSHCPRPSLPLIAPEQRSESVGTRNLRALLTNLDVYARVKESSYSQPAPTSQCIFALSISPGQRLDWWHRSVEDLHSHGQSGWAGPVKSTHPELFSIRGS